MSIGQSWVGCLLTLSLAIMSVTVRGGQTQEPGYTGSQVCADCHEAAYGAWRGSHHDLAMAEASEGAVLGDFADASVTAHGVTSSFFRRDGGWYVRTDGPDGVLQDYRIGFTFGWYPLQQYLVEMPGGRLQSLGLAWDSRPQEQGGQRWFHLYPNEEGMDHRHPLHWTGREQNWNYQCAECHSTALKKGYDPGTDSFATTWAEIDVACEACHGPGARHVEQAKAVAADGPSAWDADKGLAVNLADRDGGTWSIDPATGVPTRSVARRDHTQIELCARCHSRRGQIHDQYEHGQPLDDSHRLSLLQERLYHPDGQILDEVYVYGSFIQSKMHRAGVICTDCHDAHSLRLKLDGDRVCAQCHPVDRYAVQAHHHHVPDTPGASCIGCHMPQRLYMVNDERADHSMRIPRPDLTQRIGVPNACNQCHRDKPPQWALDAVTLWYGEGVRREPHFGEALYAGRTGAADAGTRLIDLAIDDGQPGIARATALELLRAYPAPGHLLALPKLLGDDDPLVRGAAVRYLEVTDAQSRYKLGWPLLADPVRAVRLEAARTLAPLIRVGLPQTERTHLDAALDAYESAQLVNAERPESHLNIGLVELAQGKAAIAQKAYRAALRLDPGFVPAYVNLADLYRVMGSDREAEEMLRAGLEAVPESADLHHALGLRFIRGKQLGDAVQALGRAAELAPENPRYAYVQALALKESGGVDQALSVLAAAYARHPANREILVALVTFHRDAGDLAKAKSYALALGRRFPDDPDAAALLREINAAP